MQIQSIDMMFDGYRITSNKTLLHVNQVHEWLSQKSYWAENIPFDIVYNSFLHSFTVGILKEGEQIGYARLITDYAVFGYLADVYVKEEHRGKGLSKAMMQAIMDLDWVQGCRSVMLATKDAHGLYRQYGFSELQKPDRFMSVSKTNPYTNLNQ
ncbi:MAG: GNAT family N-acetyltransferase [Flavipsychrobacter sp.]|nr:GNAT family N-acetyltransferase [Flavipsychrobacter sp.]